MQEDSKCLYVPKVYDRYGAIKELNINIDEFDSIRDKNILKIKSDENTIFTGVITSPFLLMHEDVFKVVKKYDSNIPAKKIVLLDHEWDHSQLYFLPKLSYIDCLCREKSTFINERSTKYSQIVLNAAKVQNKSIFWLLGNEGYVPIVNLDLTESILRRETRGIELIELEQA
jgi:hypothetical protein